MSKLKQYIVPLLFAEESQLIWDSVTARSPEAAISRALTRRAKSGECGNEAFEYGGNPLDADELCEMANSVADEGERFLKFTQEELATITIALTHHDSKGSRAIPNHLLTPIQSKPEPESVRPGEPVTIATECYGITVKLDGEGNGKIVSLLHEDSECDEVYDAAMDALESLILGHACAGIDITTPAYLEGVETAVEACANEFAE